MTPSSWKFFVCLAALAFFVGCSGGGAADLGAVSASGTVTLDGQPVEGASVAFSPKAPDGKAAAGLTDSSGKFTLTTVEAGDGALPGSYTVTVTKKSGGSSAGAVDPRGKGGGTELSPEEGAAAMKKMMEDSKNAAKATDLLPAKYSKADTSGLTAEVKKGGANDFTFELKSK